MKCISVEYINKSYDLYDLEIEGGSNNYIADSIVVHNTWCCLAFIPGLNNPELLDGHFFAASKGLGGQGLVFKENEKNSSNLYVRTLHANKDIMDAIAANATKPVYILGEIFGKGVQDLTYGINKPEFRVFDVYVGEPGKGLYFSVQNFINFCDEYSLKRVPLLASGSSSKELVEGLTKGKETISNGAHMREGIVIRLFEERRHPELGRVILKSVSEDYLLRKGSVTEYQ